MNGTHIPRAAGTEDKGKSIRNSRKNLPKDKTQKQDRQDRQRTKGELKKLVLDAKAPKPEPEPEPE